VNPGSVVFSGTQPLATIGAPHVVTVSNNGTAPLAISALTFSGSDAGDFLVSSTSCLGEVAAGSSCQVTVNFAPQAEGPRTAVLSIVSNAPLSPASVTLSGTGGSLPQGLAGTNGATGPPGPAGPAGKIELVTCKTVTRTVKVHGKKRKGKQQKCTARLVSGPVKFTLRTGSVHATISRGRVVYARGAGVQMGRGRTQLVLEDVRRLNRGRYTLTQRTRHRQLWRTPRVQITIG
jgi:hypothetical protein